MPATEPQTPAPIPLSHALRVAGLSNRKPTRFDIRPDAAMLAEIADFLDVLAVNALRLHGSISPRGRHDFVLEAALEAEVVQACSVTLEPVTTLLQLEVTRRYLADMQLPEAEEAELPEDVDSEPLPEVIDPGHIAVEELSLALPPYPRAPGAELAQAQFAASGVTPLNDADLRPFAGLAGLKSALEQANDQSGETAQTPDQAAKPEGRKN